MPRKIWISRHSGGLTLTAVLLVSLLIRLEQIIEAVRTTIRSDRKAGLESHGVLAMASRMMKQFDLTAMPRRTAGKPGKNLGQTLVGVEKGLLGSGRW